MGLRVTCLRLHRFRSYLDFTLEDIGPLTIIVGPNAAGKTNIIEGVQLLTALDSFRAAKTDQLITWGNDAGFIQAHFADGNRELDVGVTLDARGRHYRLNGKQRPRQDLRGVLPAVLFTPDDLQLVKGSPELRRASLDALGAQVSRNYQSVKRDYEKLLRQKNHLLKDGVAPGYLASVNEVLARIGSQLFLYRLRIVKEVQEVLADRHRETTTSDDQLALEYYPSLLPAGSLLSGEALSRYLEDRSLAERDFHAMLAQREEEERARRTSLVGPHRDKPAFLLNGRPAADFASQGQQRSIAIAFKLSELQIVEEMTHQKPVLLLDDVMSELDDTRRETLTAYVRDSVQTFITTTHLEYFTPELLERARVVDLPPRG